MELTSALTDFILLVVLDTVCTQVNYSESHLNELDLMKGIAKQNSFDETSMTKLITC